MAIHQDNTKLTYEQLLAALVAERAENERLKAKTLSFKVTEKGAVSVYGLQRFPVTLYAGQWERLAKALPELEGFIKANLAKLATKP